MIHLYSHIGLGDLIAQRDAIYGQLGADYARLAGVKLSGKSPERIREMANRYYGQMSIYEQMCVAIQERFIQGETI